MKKSITKVGVILIIILGVLFFVLYENCWKQSNKHTNKKEKNKNNDDVIDDFLEMTIQENKDPKPLELEESSKKKCKKHHNTQ